MFCNRCGSQFDGNFCPMCGAPAEAPPAQDPETAYSYREAPLVQPPYYGQTASSIPEPPPYNGLSIAGMVLGILSIVLACMCVGGLLGLVGGILSGIALKGAPKNSKALAGLITSIIGFVLAALMTVFVFISSVSAGAGQMMYSSTASVYSTAQSGAPSAPPAYLDLSPEASLI